MDTHHDSNTLQNNAYGEIAITFSAPYKLLDSAAELLETMAVKLHSLQEIFYEDEERDYEIDDQVDNARRLAALIRSQLD